MKQEKRRAGQGFLAWFDRYKWWLLGGVLVLLFVSHLYGDIVQTTRFGMNLWDSIAQGRFTQFYIDNEYGMVENRIYGGPQSPMYDIFIYILLAVWGLPLVIAEKLGVDVMNSTLCWMWMKALIVLATGGVLLLVARMGQVLGLGKEKCRWMQFYLASSVMVLCPVFVMAQYDVFSVFLSLLGILFYLKDRDVPFIACFALAAGFKMFALFLFVPLLLLKEKRILRILAAVICVMAPTMLFKLLLPLSDRAAGMFQQFAYGLFQNTLPLGSAELILFVFAFILFLFWCYRVQDIQEHQTLVPWVCLTAYGIYFCTTAANPYWIVLIAPYMVLCLFLSQRDHFQGLLLESAAGVSFTVASMITHLWCYGERTTANMLWPHILGETSPEAQWTSPAGLLTLLGLDADAKQLVVNLCITVFVAALCLFMYHTYPGHKKEKEAPAQQMGTAMVVRTVVMVGISLVPLASYFATLLLK